MICPNCERPVDALRAPIAKIVGGRVQTFCSPECARGEKPAVAPEPPPPLRKVKPPAVLVDAEPDGEESAPEPLRRREISAPVEARPRPEPRSKLRVLLPAIGLLLAAGIGGAVVQTVSPGRSSPAEAAPALAPPRRIEPLVTAAPTPAPLDKAIVLAEARQLLDGYLSSPSPRVRREAALALVRTGSPAALTELTAQLDAEPSVIAKIDVAEALAGAGNVKAREFLHASAFHERRDVRFTAGVALARLGDDKAKVPLRASMSIRLNRLSSAESLAMLGDADGVKVLEEALADKDPETKMRAAAALGRTGNPAGSETLHEMLKDQHFEQMAATALARLGDPAAPPVLTRTLGLAALAVEAATALRRMGADVDPAPLAAQMAVGDEVSRIEAAEAALVLYGDDPPRPPGSP